LDIGVLGYIGIVWPKEHSPEVWSVPPVTPCMHLRSWGLLLSSVTKASSIDGIESWLSLVLTEWSEGRSWFCWRLKKVLSAEAVVVGLVEMRSANLHVCSGVVAILLPCDHCKTSPGGFSLTSSVAKPRLILSSAKHFLTPNSAGVQSHQ